ncbi:MAG: hypothetical protein ACLFSA_00280, partial [Spirochaetaceae bacterium]
EELAQAVEVKDRKSLHRYVLLVTRQHVDQRSCDTQMAQLGGSIEKAIQSMHEGFERMDERFTQMQKQMDERFAAQDRRFDDMSDRFNSIHKLIVIGFAAIGLIITSFNLVLLFS